MQVTFLFWNKLIRLLQANPKRMKKGVASYKLPRVTSYQDKLQQQSQQPKRQTQLVWNELAEEYQSNVNNSTIEAQNQHTLPIYFGNDEELSPRDKSSESFSEDNLMEVDYGFNPMNKSLLLEKVLDGSPRNNTPEFCSMPSLEQLLLDPGLAEQPMYNQPMSIHPSLIFPSQPMTSMLLPTGYATKARSMNPCVFSLDEEQRPPLSYNELIKQAILSSDRQCMKLASIYRWIEDNFLYYRKRPSPASWKNAVRHALSKSGDFVRMDMLGVLKKKSNCWGVDEEMESIAMLMKNDKKVVSPPRKGSRGCEWCIKDSPLGIKYLELVQKSGSQDASHEVETLMTGGRTVHVDVPSFGMNQSLSVSTSRIGSGKATPVIMHSRGSSISSTGSSASTFKFMMNHPAKEKYPEHLIGIVPNPDLSFTPSTSGGPVM